MEGLRTTTATPGIIAPVLSFIPALLTWAVIPYGAPWVSKWGTIDMALAPMPVGFLFILAIQLMKSGAQAVGPSIEGQFPFANGLSTLGTGWLGAYFVLSGSPVAATAISLFGAGTISKFPQERQ